MAATPDDRKPQPWSEVTSQGYYYLTQDLNLSEDFHFIRGQKFSFTEVVGGGGFAPVTVYELKATSCAFPKENLEMVLIGEKEAEAVGVTLKPNCVIEVYVENKDLANN